MTQHMLRYKVRPDQAERNEELLRALFAELDEVQPAGLRYAAWKLDDGVTFIHLISHEPTEGKSPLPQVQALKDFHAGMRERCDEAPARSQLTEIGSFSPS